MNRKYYITLVAFLAFVGAAAAQAGGVSGDAKVIYKKELTGGLIFHSDGWGATFRHGLHKTGSKRRVLSVDLINMKHPKEFKSYNPYYEDSKGYIYGKQNTFLILRPGYGQRRILFDKMRTRGVEVGFSWSVGPSLGFAKPVYLEIGYPSIPYQDIAIERYDPNEHYIDNIFGKAPGTKGLTELKLYPGAFGKFGLHFEYSNERDGIKALETGFAIDAYPERVPIMAELDDQNAQNKQYYFTFYIKILYGKKFFR
jgi:hypothetical protein